ncbi:MAG: sporulation initiation factor Spo0A [Clostridia bacterium]|nr:sporulation initiation factor Spo0A [Clostridia bacterium]
MNILKKVARKYKTDIAEVEREINKAIAVGMSDSDPEVQAKWRELFPDGRTPTPEELIITLAKEVQKHKI